MNAADDRQARIESLAMLGLEMLEQGRDVDTDALCAGEPEDVVAAVREMLALLGKAGLVEGEQQAPSSVADGFGSYQLLDRVGSGSSGVVYRAVRQPSGEEVAVKLLRPGLEQAPKLVARFRREAEALAVVDHPGLCRLREAGEVDGVPFLELDFVAGESLARKLAQEPPAMQIVGWTEQAARALHAAHQLGLVHRDIKPGNVMVTPEDRVVILDFGLAQVADPDLRLTQTGDAVGSPAYMAPEQVIGGRVDARTDVYALGVTMYESLCGKLPFRATTRSALERSIVAGGAVPIERRLPQLPRDLARVVATAMDREPGRRYADALELAEDLARVGAGERPRARGLPWAVQVTRLVRAHPAAASFTALLLVALFVVLSLLIAVRGEARQNQVQRLAAEAMALLDDDPAAAAALALQAHALSATVATESVRRSALAADSLLAVWDHGAPVRSVCFDPDGQHVWIGDQRGQVSKHDWRTGEVASPAYQANGWVRRLAVDAERGRLAAAAGGSVHVRDASGVWRVAPQHGTVIWVGWASDGALWSVDQVGAVVRGGKPVEVDGGPLGFVPKAAAMDGSDQLWVVGKKGIARLAAGKAWEMVVTRSGQHWKMVQGLDVSPDGLRMVTGSRDRRVRSSTVAAGIRELGQHLGDVHGVTLVGERVISWSGDRQIRLWGARGPHIQTFFGHRASVQCVDADERRGRIVSGDARGQVRVFGLGGRTLKDSFLVLDERPYHWYWHQDRIVVAHTFGVFEIDLASGAVRKARDGVFGQVGVSVDGGRFAVRDTPTSLEVHSDATLSRAPDRRISVKGGVFGGNVAFTFDGRALVYGDRSNRFWLHDWASDERRLLWEDAMRLRCVAVAARTGEIALASNSGRVRYCAPDGGDPRDLLVGDGRLQARSVCFHPTADVSMVGSSDGVVRFYDGDLDELCRYEAGACVTCVVFLGDGARACATTKGGELHVWRWRTGEVEWVAHEPNGAMLLRAVPSPDQQWIATSSSSGFVRLWPLTELAVQQQLAARRLHER